MTPETYYFEIPGPERKADALAFIEEFRAYGSEINGTGGLDGYTEDYEGWLFPQNECKSVRAIVSFADREGSRPF